MSPIVAGKLPPSMIRTRVPHSSHAAALWSLTVGSRKNVLILLCAAVLVVILTAGLWPFHAPKNQVSWLRNGNGLHFGKYGIVLSPEVSRIAGSKEGIDCSVEIWLQPDHSDKGGTILAFYTLANRDVLFSVHQSIDDLFLRRVTVYQQQVTPAKLYVEHVFRENKQLFVTITSNAQGTAVYVNGALVRTSPRFGLSSKDLTGQIVVGNHPLRENGWQGQLRGLAIYNRELTASQVSRHYDAWTTNRNEDLVNEGPVALYLFNEHTGNVVHNQMNPGMDLHIPEHFLVLHAPFLERPWDEFHPGWGYWKNVLINISGFVPFGFFFCAYFVSVRQLDRAVLATLIMGGVVSLTIEALQAFLPTRDSGITDIITNTLGTAIGAMLYSCESVQSLFTIIGLGESVGSGK